MELGSPSCTLDPGTSNIKFSLTVEVKLIPLLKGKYVKNPNCVAPITSLNICGSSFAVEFECQFLKVPIIAEALAHLELPSKQCTVHAIFKNDPCISYLGPINLLLNDFDLRRGFGDAPYAVCIVFPSNDSENQINRRVARPALLSHAVPLIWLDVDGVLNCMGNGAAQTFEDLRKEAICGTGMVPWKISWSPTVVNTINRWSAVAEVVWMTSWGHNARYRLAPVLGLEDFEFKDVWKNDIANLDGAVDKERLPAYPTAADLQRPLIWIDDDLPRSTEREDEPDSWSALHDEAACLKRHVTNDLLLVCTAEIHSLPNHSFLHPEHIARVDEFLMRHCKDYNTEANSNLKS